MSELCRAILKSLVARNCLQPETAKLMESWPLERSGFSGFVGDPISQPADRPRLQRVLNYILRPALPLKHLSYVEATGQVRFSPPGSTPKLWEHAYDFWRTQSVLLRTWGQHIPRARQHHAGHFANALGNLNPKVQSQAGEMVDKPNSGKWVKWRTLILRSWLSTLNFVPAVIQR